MKGENMKKIATIFFGTLMMMALSGCGDDNSAKQEVKTYKYTTAEVYAKMCVKCHGEDGEGVAKKKGPALNDQEVYELKMGITDIKMGGSSGFSSGTEHEIMEHNMQKIIDKGMDYDTDAMAQYIYDSFNVNK
jgi:mono/diheme cytochrome c family protein